MTDRERDVAKWIAALLDELVRSGMDEDAHHRYRCTNSVDDQDNPSGLFKWINPPTYDEIKSIEMEGVLRYLMPLIRFRLEQVAEDYEREDGR
jgi:hypothetical protein